MGYQRARTATCDWPGCDARLLLEPPTETQLERLAQAGWRLWKDCTFCVVHHAA